MMLGYRDRFVLLLGMLVTVHEASAGACRNHSYKPHSSVRYGEHPPSDAVSSLKPYVPSALVENNCHTAYGPYQVKRVPTSTETVRSTVFITKSGAPVQTSDAAPSTVLVSETSTIVQTISASSLIETITATELSTTTSTTTAETSTSFATETASVIVVRETCALSSGYIQ